MNKLDFLRILDKELQVLDQEERRELLAFYDERFYTGTIYENKTEEEVIAELESPKEIARNILAEYGASPKFVKTKEERYSKISLFNAIFIISFDVIIASWLIPALFTVAFSIFGSSLTYVTSFSLLVGERTTVDEFVFVFMTAAYILIFLFGIVVLDAGIYVTKQLFKWHLNVFKIKGRDKMIKKLSHVSTDKWFKKHRGIRRLKNFALIGSLVAITYTGFWIFNHYDWVQAEYGRGALANETITEDFASEITAGDTWTIETDFELMEVEIVLVSGDEVNVKHSYYEDDNFAYDFDYDNNVLTISNDLDNNIGVFWNFTDIFTLISNDYEVRIEVPEGLLLDDIVLKTTSGSIDVTNVDFDTLSLITSNGRISVSEVTLKSDLLAHSTNGSIIISNVTVIGNGTLDAVTSNGTIDVEDVNFAVYNINTSNGRINLRNLNIELQDGITLDANTSNGKIMMNEVYVDDIELDTSNGDIEFYNDDTTFIPSRFEKDTSNGQISTNVR